MEESVGENLVTCSPKEAKKKTPDKNNWKRETERRNRFYDMDSSGSITILCEWKNCDQIYNLEEMSNHMDKHVKNLTITVQNKYICDWRSCSSEFEELEQAIRHVHYHGYMSVLRARGETFVANYDFPTCQKTVQAIPPIPQAYVCKWGKCKNKYDNILRLAAHATTHLTDSKNAICKWYGCVEKFSSKIKLQKHVKTHTHEKVAACPDCHATFSSLIRLKDHLHRQIPEEDMLHQCLECGRRYGSLNIMKSHMYSHIKFYKRSLFRKRFTTKSLIKENSKNNHVDERRFEYQQQNKFSKSNKELKSHANEKSVCESVTTQKSYMCHVCSYVCSSASLATQHYKRAHKLIHPAGQNQLQYQKNNKGFFQITAHILMTCSDKDKMHEELDPFG